MLCANLGSSNTLQMYYAKLQCVFFMPEVQPAAGHRPSHAQCPRFILGGVAGLTHEFFLLSPFPRSTT
jgi:hypothetical protein